MFLFFSFCFSFVYTYIMSIHVLWNVFSEIRHRILSYLYFFVFYTWNCGIFLHFNYLNCGISYSMYVNSTELAGIFRTLNNDNNHHHYHCHRRYYYYYYELIQIALLKQFELKLYSDAKEFQNVYRNYLNS